MPSVIFRADGNNQIGLGHVIRSCALATMLKEDFERHFFIKDPSPALQEDILKSCDFMHILPIDITTEDEAFRWEEILTGKEIVVLDGYHFTTSYQQSIKAKGCKIVCIDDIYNYHFLADIVINHAGGLSRKDYSLAPLTQLCLGTEYALLREEFLNVARDRSNTESNTEKDEIFICLGGADINNDLIGVLTLLETKNIACRCNVVLGSAYLHHKALAAFMAKTVLQIDIIQNAPPSQLVSLMKKCRYGICPPSTVSYEYLSVGGELYLKQTADNQKDVFAFFINAGLAFELHAFGQVAEDTVKKSLIEQARFFDGNSSKRLKILFNRLARENSLQVRSAGLADADLFYEWANDPEVRATALSTASIHYESHINWFATKCNDTNTHMYIISENNIALGQVRFDLDSNDNTALISYSINKMARGTGLGGSILKLATQRLLQDIEKRESICLKAIVRTENIPSKRVFENLGFTLDKEDTIHGLSCNFYSQIINPG